MTIQATSQLSSYLPAGAPPAASPSSLQTLQNEAGQAAPADDARLKEVFHQFVGETFFHQLIKSMRSTLGKPAYFHGGQAEEIFQSQLDQHLVSDLANNAGLQFSEDLYDLFRLQLRDANSAQAQNQNEPHSPGTATETLLERKA